MQLGNVRPTLLGSRVTYWISHPRRSHLQRTICSGDTNPSS